MFKSDPNCATLMKGNAHNVVMTNIYANGVYPHYEYHNSGSITNGRLRMGELRCRSLSEFRAP